MPKFVRDPDARSWALAISILIPIALLTIGAMQLAFRIPDQIALPLAWCSLGLVILIFLVLLRVSKLAWIVGSVIFALGAAILFLGVMAREHQWGQAIGGFLAITLVIAITGAYKQTRTPHA